MNRNIRKILTGFFMLIFSMPVAVGQQAYTHSLSLQEAIIRARVNSVDAEVALNQLKSSYWAYRAYRAELLPELTFTGNIPSFYRQYTPYMDQEGNYSFVRNNYLQMNGEISINQNIWFTGGTISLNSSLDFYRQLGEGAYNRFMSLPVALTLNQPIFGVNNIKWDRKIEPIRYEEAKANFISQTEEVAILAIQYYFSLLLAKENLCIAQQNFNNAKKLYEVAKEKRIMGQISNNDLLQMELNLVDAQTELTDCESTLKSNMFQLQTFLGFDSGDVIEVDEPLTIPEAKIDYEYALARALENNSFSKEMLRIQLEADYEVAKAKGAQREINLFAQIGYTGVSHNARGSYQNLNNNQIVQMGFEIPLVDWGRRKGLVKVAESNRKLIESRVKQENQNFRQNLFILIERYGNQLQQLKASKRADEIARQRYETNVETFLIGKISTLDLNDSRTKKDEARREYINELYMFWLYYYQIRSLTLWDYEKGESIDMDIESIVNS